MSPELKWVFGAIVVVALALIVSAQRRSSRPRQDQLLEFSRRLPSVADWSTRPDPIEKLIEELRASRGPA